MKIETLIAECTAYDFKVMLEEKKHNSWLKTVSAFANGLSDTLFFDIDNDGIVRGLNDVQHICWMNNNFPMRTNWFLEGKVKSM